MRLFRTYKVLSCSAFSNSAGVFCVCFLCSIFLNVLRFLCFNDYTIKQCEAWTVWSELLQVSRGGDDVMTLKRWKGDYRNFLKRELLCFFTFSNFS